MAARLNDQFYSADLRSVKTVLRPSHCFFITEHVCNKALIHKLALQLFRGQCKNFEFYGARCSERELEFDEFDIMLHPGDDEDIALTSAWKSMDQFVDALDFALSIRKIVPLDVFLLYDDTKTYQTVLQKLEKFR